MDQTYDVAVLGTGLTECILSGLLSIDGKKVLQMDRNNYYGAASASICPLSALFSKFNVNRNLEKFGRGNSWNVDLIPKLLMADGKMVSLLVHTGVTKYLNFRSISGSYVMYKKRIHKVPSTEKEALTFGIGGFFSKTYLANMLKWVAQVEEDKPSTWNNICDPPLDIRKDTIQRVFDHFKIDETIQNFVGHALCLYSNDSYKTKASALEVVEKIQLYHHSVSRFGHSPYVYPLYGLGELPQAFARLSAVYGGTFMLDKPVEEIVFENGKVVGVKADGEVASCHTVICDPSYAPEYVRKVGQVVRAICILDHPIAHTKNASSFQIIIPQNEVGRQHDIYVSCVGSEHVVSPAGFYIALVATTVETTAPLNELKPGLALLEPIDQMFHSVDDLYEPVDDGTKNQLFISNSYDASTHFETTCADVLRLYKNITGTDFDFTKVTDRLMQNDDDG